MHLDLDIFKNEYLHLIKTYVPDFFSISDYNKQTDTTTKNHLTYSDYFKVNRLYVCLYLMSIRASVFFVLRHLVPIIGSSENDYIFFQYMYITLCFANGFNDLDVF